MWEEKCKDKKKRSKTDKAKKTFMFKQSPPTTHFTISPYKCDLDIKVELKQEPPTMSEGDSKQLNIEPSDLIKLEQEDHILNVSFRQGANKEILKRYLDSKAEETKLKMGPKVSGRKPLPPYRRNKRGTLAVSYKLAMDDLEEMNEIGKIGLKKTNVDGQGFSSAKSKVRFKHYKEFIAPKQEVFDPTVISRLLSLTPRNRLRKKRFSSEGDTSKEVVDSLPLTHTSEIDHDDWCEKDNDNFLIQVDHKSPSVSVKFDNSMPLIE
jgi:hypothetical protein